MCSLRNLLISLSIWLALAGAPAEALGPAPLAPQPRVRIEPAEAVVGPGDTFTVEVVIEEARDLGGFQFDLVYDPAIVQVKEVDLGGFLGSTGRSVVPVGPKVEDEAGRMPFGAISFGSGPGPSGMGTLAAITLKARGEGSTVLDLRDVQVLDTGGSPQPVTAQGGQVVVRGAEAPTPVATATPTPAATATPAPAATATPGPTNTPEAADTPGPPATALPSPTPSVTSPAVETPTEAPPPSPTPTPSVSITPTETKPTEVTTPLAVPTVEATEAPVAVTTVEATKAPAAATAAPTSPPTTPPPPSTSPIPMPSPTPLATISVPAATGSSGGAVLGLMLAALAVAILAIFMLSRKPGG